MDGRAVRGKPLLKKRLFPAPLSRRLWVWVGRGEAGLPSRRGFKPAGGNGELARGRVRTAEEVPVPGVAGWARWFIRVTCAQ